MNPPEFRNLYTLIMAMEQLRPAEDDTADEVKRSAASPQEMQRSDRRAVLARFSPRTSPDKAFRHGRSTPAESRSLLSPLSPLGFFSVNILAGV